MELRGKVAIVTGSATGIGQAIAVAYAKAGAAVVVDYVGDAATANETLAKIAATGGASIAIETDVSQPADVDRLVAGTVAKFGRLDALVNDAGIEKKLAFLDYPLEEWQKIIAVNLTGPFLCSQAAAKQMIKQGQGGRIVNISSIHEDLPLVLNAPYSASKGGLRMLMRTIAVELAPHKIGVNNLAPMGPAGRGRAVGRVPRIRGSGLHYGQHVLHRRRDAAQRRKPLADGNETFADVGRTWSVGPFGRARP